MTSQEEKRLQVPQASLELILNLNQVLISDCDDCQTRNAIFPTALFSQRTGHEVSGNAKQQHYSA
jgi:hypothetical protein